MLECSWALKEGNRDGSSLIKTRGSKIAYQAISSPIVLHGRNHQNVKQMGPIRVLNDRRLFAVEFVQCFLFSFRLHFCK